MAGTLRLVLRLAMFCLTALLAAVSTVLRVAWTGLYASAALAIRLTVLAFFALWSRLEPGRPVGPVLSGRHSRRPARVLSPTRHRARVLDDYHSLSPAQFEQAVARLLARLGYSRVRRVGGTGDLAVDIVCRDRDGRSVAVQCKRYAPHRQVGSQEMQQFIGMMTVHHHADQGVYVTTSRFTQPARELGTQHGIELIDGARLAALTLRAERNRRGFAPATLETGAEQVSGEL